MTGDGNGEARWRDLPAGETADSRAGDLVRRIGEPELPGDERLAAIRARISLRSGPRVVRRGFTGVLVAISLLAGTTLGLAASGWIAPLRERLRGKPAEVPAPAADPPRRRSSRHRPPAPAPGESPQAPLLEAPEVDPAPAVAAPAPVVAPPARRRPGPLIASAAEAPAPEPRRESAVLASAIRKLRRDGDARGALATLDEYGAAFPAGALGAEADLLRVEALLALGERAAALRLLDERADTNPRPRQALLVRGELRAAVGRCAEAARDLGRVLGSPPRDRLDARALYARASCLSRLHEYAAARGDLQAYLRSFPDGPHAGQAASTLRALP